MILQIYDNSLLSNQFRGVYADYSFNCKKYMLTKDDLQAIQQIVKVEVKKEIKDGLFVGLKSFKKDVASLKTDISLFKTDISTLKNDVSSLKTNVSSLNKSVSNLKTDMKIVKTDIRTLKQDVSYISREFDGHIIDTIRRVDRIEGHLRLPPLQAN